MSRHWKEAVILLICLGGIIQMIIFPLGPLFTYKMGREHKVWMPVFQNVFPYLFYTVMCLPFAIYKLASSSFTYSKKDFFKYFLSHYALVGFLDVHAFLGFTFALRFTSLLSLFVIMNSYTLFAHIASFSKTFRNYEFWRYVLFGFNIFGLISFCISDYYQQNGNQLFLNKSYNATEFQPTSINLQGNLMTIISTICLTFSIYLRKGLIDRSSKTFTVGLSSFFSLLVLTIYYFIFELSSSIDFLITDMYQVDDNFFARLYFIGYFIVSILNTYWMMSIQQAMPNQYFGIIIFFAAIQAIIYNFTVFQFKWNPGHIVAMVSYAIASPLNIVLIQDTVSPIEKDEKERFF